MFGIGLVDNAIVSVNKVLFEFVRKHTFHRSALELFADSRNCFSHSCVSRHFFDRSQGSLLSVVGSKDYVSFPAIGFGATDNDRVRSLCNIAVNVAAKVDFSNVALLKRARLIWQRREMAADLIYRNATGEGDSAFELFRLLIAEDFLELLFHELITSQADGVDIGSHHGQFDGFLERLVRHFSSGFVLVENSWHIDERGIGVLLFLVRGLNHSSKY